MPDAAARFGEPFHFPGGRTGVLLVHGFLTGPAEMRPLGEALAAAGLTVMGLCLSGHGACPEALAGVPWTRWAEDVERGLEALAQHCDEVCLAGLSLGGALALYAAARRPLKRLVTFSAPAAGLGRLRWVACLRPLLRLGGYLPKLGSDLRDPDARRAHATYRRFPLRSVLQVLDLVSAADAALPQVRTPCLLVHARRDQVVTPQAPAAIAARLGGPARIAWIERGGHTVVMDYDCQRVFELTRDWLTA